MNWIIDVLFTFDLFLVSALIFGMFIGCVLVFCITMDAAYNDKFFLD